MYLFTTELFRKKKTGLLAALLLAISPWHLQFTRTAYEVGIQPFLTAAGLYFFLNGLRTKKSLKLILAALFLGLGMYLYTASRVFIPLLVFSAVAIYYRSFFQTKKLAGTFLLVFFIFLIPTLYLFTTVAGQMRFSRNKYFPRGGPT